MKTSKNSSSPFKRIMVSAIIVAGLLLPARAVDVLLSGTSQAGNQPLIDFLNNNFRDVNLTFGNYSDYAANAAAIEAADVFIVGRILSSAAYANAVNSASFNALTNPVVAFTSYVTRPDGGRWGWHSGGVTATGPLVVGTETTVTTNGAAVFGIAADTAVDWFTEGTGTNFFATGTGTVGDGEILATMGGEILAAHWVAGELSGSGIAFGGERFLFNLSDSLAPGGVNMPNAAGRLALIKALDAYTPLEAVDVAFSTSPQDGDTEVAVDRNIMVTATDVGVDLASLMTGYEMLINSSVVSGVITNSANGITTFTYDPPADLAHETEYTVQLNIFRSDAVTNTASFSFTTIQDNAVKVLFSGTTQGNNQPLIDFLTENFQDVVLTYGNFADYSANAAAIESADLFVVGRFLSSPAYANAANSAAFNALSIPVLAFTSYVTRTNDARWGWHNGDVLFGDPEIGDETTVTSAGATTFGIAEGDYDWYMEGAGFNAAGTGSVGDGEILATIGGNILAAHWNAGDLSGSGVAFGGERFLFNISQGQPGSVTILPGGAGQLALLRAIEAHTPLVAKDPVALAPAIAPANTAYEGETRVLSAVTSGTGPLTFQWQWDQGLGGGFSDITGANSQTYTQDTTGLFGTYSYQVIVNNNIGNTATSSVVSLTVNTATFPLVTTDTTPLSANAYVGGSITFTAGFEGNPPITYQWQFSSDFGATWSDLGGQTNTILTLANLQTSNGGYYRLQAVNSLGTNWSTLALLTILAAPPSSGDATTDVLALNPVAYWPLNDNAIDPGSDTALVYDASGNGHTGAYGLYALNGYWSILGPQAADGYPRFANGQGAMNVTPNLTPSWATTPPLDLNTDTVTISAWVWPDGVQSNFAGIFMNGNAGSVGGLSVGNSNELRYTWVSDSTNQWGHDTGLVLPVNEWSFVALVVEPAATTWYLYNTNGLQTDSYAVTNPVMPWTGNSANIRIGSDSRVASRVWQGSIDEVAVFDRALSEAEVLQLATGVLAPQMPTLSISRSGSDLVVSWPNGTLLEANEVTGPWTTNSAAVSPYTNTPAGDQRYFRAVAP